MLIGCYMCCNVEGGINMHAHEEQENTARFRE